MKHSWISGLFGSSRTTSDWKVCTKCGAQIRTTEALCPGVRPDRHSYSIRQYRVGPDKPWRWIRTRQQMPPCEPRC